MIFQPIEQEAAFPSARRAAQVLRQQLISMPGPAQQKGTAKFQRSLFSFHFYL